jgi:hypothetical protein
MAQPDLWIICIVAFLSVFVLLSILAATMRVLTAVFPAPRDDSDAALLAAVSAVAAAAYPGMQVTHVEETR